jgi:hypothetical protein
VSAFEPALAGNETAVGRADDWTEGPDLGDAARKFADVTKVAAVLVADSDGRDRNEGVAAGEPHFRASGQGRLLDELERVIS